MRQSGAQGILMLFVYGCSICPGERVENEDIGDILPVVQAAQQTVPAVFSAALDFQLVFNIRHRHG